MCFAFKFVFTLDVFILSYYVFCCPIREHNEQSEWLDWKYQVCEFRKHSNSLLLRRGAYFYSGSREQTRRERRESRRRRPSCHGARSPSRSAVQRERETRASPESPVDLSPVPPRRSSAGRVIDQPSA